MPRPITAAAASHDESGIARARKLTMTAERNGRNHKGLIADDRQRHAASAVNLSESACRGRALATFDDRAGGPPTAARAHAIGSA
jgi:hypothetical protein